MNEPTPVNEIPDNIGRNEPCPCGSGKKYKKCCQNAHRVQKEATKTTRTPEQLIGPKTTPWAMFKILRQVRETNAPNLLWEMAHEDGPFRERYATKETFFEALGSGKDKMVAGDGFDLMRVRHDGPDVLLMLTRGQDDPHRSTLTFEVVTLRPNELGPDRRVRVTPAPGFRIWNVERFEKRKAEVEGEVDFAALGYEWAPAWKAPA